MSLIEKAAKRLEELRRARGAPPRSRGEDAAVDHSIESIEGLAVDSEPGSNPRSAVNTEQSNPAAPSLSTPATAHQSRQVTLDFQKLAATGLVTPNTPRTQLAEEFRVIKQPLITNAAGKGAAPVANGNLIMVTSSLPGEGKTFTAVNLALSIAMELDRTVLLVDADVSRPSLPRYLGVPSNPGLLDILHDSSLGLADAILRTNIDKFSILPGGTPHERATELLASTEMTNLLHEMAHRYADRIIIFDSPPLLVTTEARVLASHMGQIVFVVQAESTLQRDVLQALAMIEYCPVKLMVLNKANTSGMGRYGYSYGYGQAA